MGHCPYAQLGDLEDLFKEIRQWPQVIESKPGVFYVKRTAFLHFHLRDDKRWADARCGTDWGPSVEIPFGASKAAKAAFLRAVTRCYQASLAALASNG